MSGLYSALLTGAAHLSKVLSGFILLKLIAYYLGAEGLGTLGHFMSLVAILSMLAGGGVVNGVIKYVSEFKATPRKMMVFITASTKYSLVFSFSVFLLGVFFSGSISFFIFGSLDYYLVIVCLALAQIGFAFSNLVIGVINGLRETKTYAKLQITGNLISLPLAYIFIINYGFTGAAFGIVAIYLMYSIPAFYYFYKSPFYGRVFKYKPAAINYKKLSLFTAMLVSSAVAFPVVEIFIREYLIDASGYKEAGLWQGAIKLSSAYLGFFGVFLAYYFMPLISATENKSDITQYVVRFSSLIMGLFLIGAGTLYGFRSFFIPLLLSNDFVALQDYIVFQLIGDFFRISAYVIGFVGVAKAATKIYIFAELFQSVCFFSLAFFLSKYYSQLEGVFIGYMLTYILYFLIAVCGFMWWGRR